MLSVVESLDESHDVSLVGFVCVVQRLEDFHFFLCSFFHHIVGANDLQRHQRFTLCLGILGFHHVGENTSPAHSVLHQVAALQQLAHLGHVVAFFIIPVLSRCTCGSDVLCALLASLQFFCVLCQVKHVTTTIVMILFGLLISFAGACSSAIGIHCWFAVRCPACLRGVNFVVVCFLSFLGFLFFRLRHHRCAALAAFLQFPCSGFLVVRVGTEILALICLFSPISCRFCNLRR
mmetsp:Transcript_24496/g.53425  ORF Transcript_24496/g.53425 Transcript_24496/m.53425 type:complete len:234 (+) Transcript_24496:887-1588(+)